MELRIIISGGSGWMKLHRLSSSGKKMGPSEHGKMLGKYPDTFSFWRKELKARKNADVSIETAFQIIFLPAVFQYNSLSSPLKMTATKMCWSSTVPTATEVVKQYDK